MLVLDIKTNNEYELIYEYISFIKHRLGISRDNEVKTLSMMIHTVNDIFRTIKAKTIDECREYMNVEYKKKLISHISILDSKMPPHSFISTLYELRKARKVPIGTDKNGKVITETIHILDTSNVPYRLSVLRPVYCNYTNDRSITINFELNEE